MTHPLLSRDVLLGLGVCLIMLGLVLRGFARDYRRDSARRQQHLRDERKSTEAGLGTHLEQPPGWLEKNLGRLANLVVVTGALVAVAAIWRG